MSIQRYFETLGLDQKVTVQKAKESYINLVRIWHPDQFSNDTVFKARAEEKLKEINVAYSEVRSYLSRQNALGPSLRSNIKKISLILLTCRDIASKMGVYFYGLMQKSFRRAYAVDTKLKNASYRSSTFADTVHDSGRNRQNHQTNFQNVLEDVIREKSRPDQFGL